MSTAALNLSAPWDEVSSLLDSPVFLEASAGSGKTFTLERLVLTAVLKGIPMDAILGVTFTEKSAQDLRTKVRKTLREARKAALGGSPEWPALIGLAPRAPLDPLTSGQRIKEALDNFSKSRFLTIHGFCQSVLTAFPFEAGLPFQTRLEGKEWEYQAALDYLRPLLPSPEIQGLSPSLWMALGQSMDGAAEYLLQMKSQGWFRPQGLASATPLPEKKELDRLWKDFLNLEEELAGGHSALRRALAALGSLKVPNLACWDSEENRAYISRMDSMPGRLRALQAVINLGTTSPDLPILPMELDPEMLRRLEDWGSDQKMLKKAWSGPTAKNSLPDTPEAEFYRKTVPLVDHLLEELAAYRDTFLAHPGDVEALCRLKFFHDHVNNFTRFLDKKAREEGVLTFDAMISLVHGALQTEGGNNTLAKALRNKYRILLMDEFQDTDHLQWGIFRTLFLHRDRSLITVGDPKQGIYGFRGADLQVYLDSRSEITAPELKGKALHLPMNFRSGRGLVEAVNLLSARLFQDNPDQSQGVSFHPATAAASPEGLQVWDGLPGVELVQLPPGAGQASLRRRILFQDCARRLASLQGVLWSPQREGQEKVPLGWSDMAVLVQTSREGRQVLAALESQGIPATLYGRNPLFATPEALDLALFFQVLQDPGRVEGVMALGISPLMEIPLQDLIDARDDGRMILWMDYLTTLRDLSLKGRYLKAFRKLFNSSEPGRWFPDWKPLEQRILQKPEGERILANLRHMVEILQAAEQTLPLPLDQVAGYLYSRARKDPSQEETNLRLDRDEQAVRILTLHGSKGLEFPVVYLAGGYSSKYPDSPSPSLREQAGRQRKTVCFLKDPSGEGSKAEKDFAEAEKRRLIYVALTRAKARLVLGLPPEDLEGKSRSRLSDWWTGWKAQDFSDSKLFHVRPPLVPREPGSPDKRAPAKDLERPSGLPPPDLNSRLLSMTSYTSLVRESSPAPVSSNLTGMKIQVLEENQAPVGWMEDLGGTGFGTFYHEVLEKIDFSAQPGDLELQSLAANNLPPRDFDRRPTWIPGFLAHRQAFLNHHWTLDGSPFRFSSLTKGQHWKEVDFFMSAVGSSGEFLGKNLQVPRGLIQGAIDLIFLHRDKIWVLDWKTTRVEEHLLSPQGLAKAMEEEGYLVQMGIYWTALRRILASWGSPYALGGVLYAYLRHNTLVQFTPDGQDSSRWESFLAGGQS